MNVFIRQSQANYQWFKTAENILHPEILKGSLDELAEYYQQNPQVKNWVLVAPAIETSSRTVTFSEKEKKHILKAIPFLLEESLLTEADDLHFVMNASAQPNAMDVVAIDDGLLEHWLLQLREAGLTITHCIAESLFLPDSDSDWQIFYRADEFIIRAQSGECVGIDAKHFALSLALLSDGYSKMPASVELITENEADYAAAMALMPAAITPLISTTNVSYPLMVQQQFTTVAKVWNMMTGKFVQAHEWMALVKPWRWVLASFAAVFCLNLFLMMAEVSQLKQENSQLRQQMDNVFRQVVPRGNIVDHRKQLERELRAATNGGSGEPFIRRMEKVGSVLEQHQVKTINALNYDAKKSEIRLDFITKDYDALQGIMADMKQTGLEAEIQNSNAQGDQLRTRLRITG